jgi:hypothetical protein
LTPAINSRLLASNGYYYFEDGHFKCVLMNALDVSVKVVNRTAKEYFDVTVEHTDPRLQLVLNANYGGNSVAAYLPGPEDPSQDIEGQVVEDGKAVAGTLGKSETLKAFFAFQPKSADTERIQFGLGDPPSTSVAGFGGLVPLILKGSKFDESNRWYKNFSGKDPRGGRLALARSANGRHLLAMLQPQGSAEGLHVGKIRDKLVDADMGDAVLLDGSTSVMMYLERAWKVRQIGYKNTVTRVGVGFFYEPNAARAVFTPQELPNAA